MTGLKEWTSSFGRTVQSWFAQQLNEQKSKGTIAALDGVRALAFLLVFEIHINHAGVWGDGNNPFVAAFFFGRKDRCNALFCPLWFLALPSLCSGASVRKRVSTAKNILYTSYASNISRILLLTFYPCNVY